MIPCRRFCSKLYMVLLPLVLLVAFIGLARAQDEDATALEARYKTCARHSIPSDKCSPDIYRQLKEKDNAPLEPKAAAALKAAKEYQSRLKNPNSMQLRTAYVLDARCRHCGSQDYLVCLEVGGQNGMGGMTVTRVAVTFEGEKEHWYDSTGMLAGLAPDSSDRWEGICTKPRTPFSSNPKLLPGGTDVTDAVSQQLSPGR